MNPKQFIPPGEPTPEEIEAIKLQIQKGWSEDERASGLVVDNLPVEITEVAGEILGLSNLDEIW